MNVQIEAAAEKFKALLIEQLTRVEKMKALKDFLDFTTLSPIVIGVAAGDGIGPAITKEARRILAFLLADEVKSGKVEFRVIDGLTIENRAA
ncbi:MAG: isocitrate/isopropylmalate dehydrogenase family protein, partial [Hyphomonadaceae bacterium]|nr:isocitrate/isopropylmalate dehydrogenase family protein [Clostridia bacterium]